MRQTCDTAGSATKWWPSSLALLLCSLYLYSVVWLVSGVTLPVLLTDLEPVAITSGSMAPRINTGDVVLNAPYRGERRLGRNVVVTFRHAGGGGQLTTHRIIALNPDGTYRTKGDANPRADSTPLAADRIEGLGRALVPRAALPLIWLDHRQLLPLAAWPIVTLLCALYVSGFFVYLIPRPETWSLPLTALPLNPLPVSRSAPAARHRLRRWGRACAGAVSAAVDWRRPIGPRAAISVLLAWVLVAGGAITGAAQGAFVESSGNGGNNLETAGAFSAQANEIVGTASSCAATTTVVSVPGTGVDAGSTLVLRVAARGGSSTGAYSATDSRGNAYSRDADAINGTAARSVVLSARITTALVSGDVITVSHPSAVVHSVVVTRLTGISEVGRVDATATGVGSGNRFPVASITTVTQNALTIGAVAANPPSTWTSSSGWTAMAPHQPACSGSALGNFADYRLLAPGTHSFAPSLVSNTSWAVAAVAYKPVDMQAPAVPTLSGVNGDAENTLSWTAVTDPSPPVVYKLYRNGTEVYSGPNLTYNDITVTNGTQYSYVVKAGDAMGNQSGASNSVVLTPSAGASIRFVKNLSPVTCGGAGGTTSTFTVPAGGVAAGNTLLIRYASRESVDATLVNQLAVSDNRGNAYALDAHAFSGNRVLSGVVGGYISTALQAGDTITLRSPTGSFHLVGISEFSGIAPSERVMGSATEALNGLNVSLSVGMTEPRAMVYATVATRAATTAPAPDSWTGLPSIASTCSNTGTAHAAYRRPLTTGMKTYAVTMTGGSSEKASILLAYRAQLDLTAPPAPELSGSSGYGQNALSWTSVTDPTPPVTYQLRRDGQEVYSGTATTFTDTGLTNGTTYTYTVRATDAAGNVSVASNNVALIPTPIAFVKQVGTRSCVGTGTSVTSQITVPAAGVAAGNSVLLRVVLSGATPETGPISAVDSKGNTYALDRSEINAGRVRTAVVGGFIGTALQSGDTITVTHPGATGSAVVAEEFAGIAATNRIDNAAGVNGSSNTPIIPLTSTVQNTLFYGVVGTQLANRTHTPPGSPWVALGALVPAGCTVDNHGAYARAASATSFSYNPTLSAASQMAAVGVVYRSAIDVTPPPAPTLSGAGDNGRNDLTWTTVTDPSAPVTYRLSRDGQEVYSGTATSFTDTGLTNGTTYTYVVSAEDGVGNTSAASNSVNVVPTPIKRIKEVARRTCGGTSSALAVPASGVAAGNTVLIRVVIREGLESAAVTATDSKGNTYTADADAIRPGRVRAVILSGLVATPLVAGDSITVSHPAGTGQIVVAEEFAGIAETSRVDSVGTGANNNSVPSASVTLTQAKTLLFGVLATRSIPMTAPAGWEPLAGISLTCSSVTTSGAAHRSTLTGGTYTFAPTMAGGDEWAAALVAYRSAVDLTPPPAPVLSGAVGNTQNTLSWTAVTDPTTPVTYQLFRGSTQIYSGTATSFVDTGLVNSAPYNYVVRASDGADNQSTDSNAVTLIPTPIQFVTALGALTCGAGGGSITVPAEGAAAGQTVIVRVTVLAGIDANALTVTDNKGNVYQEDANAVWPTNKVRTAIFSARVATPLIAGDTISVAHGTGSVQAAAMSFSGIREVGRRHTFGVASNSNATPAVSATTVEASTLLVGVVGTRAVRTFNPPASGWTPLASLLCSNKTPGISDLHAGWRLTSQSGLRSYDATLTGGNDEWAAVLVAYRPE